MTKVESLLADLHGVLERADRLNRRTERQFTELLRKVCTHTLHGDPEEGPLGIAWTLRHGGVCEQLFAEITGESPYEKETFA